MVSIPNEIKQVFSIIIAIASFLSYVVCIYISYNVPIVTMERYKLDKNIEKIVNVNQLKGTPCEEWKKSLSKIFNPFKEFEESLNIIIRIINNKRDQRYIKGINNYVIFFWIFTFFYLFILGVSIYLSVIYDTEEEEEKKENNKNWAITIVSFGLFILLMIWITEYGFQELVNINTNAKVGNYKRIHEKDFKPEVFTEKMNGIRMIFEKKAVIDNKYWSDVFWWGGFFIFVSIVFGGIIIWGEE